MLPRVRLYYANEVRPQKNGETDTNVRFTMDTHDDTAHGLYGMRNQTHRPFLRDTTKRANAMSTKATPVNPAPSTAGILDRNEAAEMLGMQPIEVQRLVALSHLPDNRNTKGSVFFQSDLEAYLGRGVPGHRRIASADGWFANDAGFPSLAVYRSRMRRFESELQPVSDSKLLQAFKETPDARSHSFAVPATESMKKVFNSHESNSAVNRNGPASSFGVSVLAGVLRGAGLQSICKKKRSFETPIDYLFTSPKRFGEVKRQSLQAITQMAVEFREERHVPKVGGKLTIIRTVSFEALSPNPSQDIVTAIDLAF